MKVLHYSLGFPPERTGGLIHYTLDLIKEQIKQGVDVVYLHPRSYKWYSKQTKIKKDVRRTANNLLVFQLEGSLPLPLFGGIKSPNDFMFSVDKSIYYHFLENQKPDCIHIHTLMGIHKTFFEVAKELNIPIFYTTHDYFGIAPEPTFFYQGYSYDEKNTAEMWADISNSALSTTKLRLFQSRFYPFLRTILSKINKNNPLVEDKIISTKNNDKLITKFELLKKYYTSIFSYVDYFIFNSTLTKSVYSSNLPFSLKGEVLHVTNSKIKKASNFKKTKSDKIRIAYIGQNKQFKGLDDFIELSTRMDLSKYEFHTYGYVPTTNHKNIHQHGKYNYMETQSIHEKIDILVVPSKCKETFALVVLEAIAFKTITFVSKNVGAKDLLNPHSIFGTIDELRDKINSLITTEEAINFDTISTHTKKIGRLYQETIINQRKDQ